MASLSQPASEPNTSPLAKFIWGPENLQRRCDLLKELPQHAIFKNEVNLAALSRRDHWAYRVQQAQALIGIWLKKGWSRDHFLDANRMIGEMPCSPQFRIFFKNIQAQMSPEQKAFWIPKVERFEILGCYAQTEVGHGSNLRGIETSATFDSTTDEFILESPTVSSSKIWIGALGAWATHAIVVSRLIVNGHDHGNHLFMVQVRDLKTHDVLPGITIYEQRDKTLNTLRGLDNGVMRFFGHRIPRSQMFAGSSSLSRDGTYNPPINKNHSYTSMVIIRGLLSSELGLDAMKALYIAAHYVAFRRQFGANPGGMETRVIDYASVKNRLFPAIAREVAIILNGRQITAAIEERLGTNMEDMHIMSVGGKVYASEHAARDVEIARLLCGGHGTHESAGLGRSYTLLSAARTYEGDSYVISLQLGRAITKCWQRGGEDTLPALGYLRRLRKPTAYQQRLRQDESQAWHDRAVQDDVLEQRVSILAGQFLEDTRKGKDTSFQVLELTMAHTDLHYVRGLYSALESSPEEGKMALKALANLFTISTLVNGLSTFAGSDYLSYNDIRSMKEAYQTALVEFEPHVPCILGAFAFTPWETRSSLCPVDKSPYDAIVGHAMGSELNDNRFMRPTILNIRSLWKNQQESRL
ncbi:hypothetical protein AJ80_03662 [Polytolypa hystricis UAMH7299]|uniref:Acyl-coenzyme A oxidase n=1 Tax=Polytolypa hystricis (strain UAMH7299) TaxID=1447883 RepID=A0A2B7Y7N3_POLH7|nr:hypothetical protein AJ80_03662 [Polytolypa hystricis UAMH7299]